MNLKHRQMKRLFVLALGLGLMTYGADLSAQLKVVSSGFVGINESSPTQLLTISNESGPANFLVRRTDSGNFIKAVGGANGAAYFFKKENFFAITPGDNQNDQSTNWGNALVLYGNSASNGRAGKVGIGTQNPDEKLVVNGNIKLLNGGMLITSDKRTKTNVSDLPYGLKEVLTLKPLMYNYNGKAGTSTNETHFGIYAQNLQKVAPELVKEFTHREYAGNPLEGEETVTKEEKFLSIRDNEIKYLLINAIKEQQGQIEMLEEKLLSLEEKLSELHDGNTQQVEIFGDHDQIGSSMIEQNAPNPHNGQTVIRYNVSDGSNGTIHVSDMNGKLLKTVQLASGKGQIELNMTDLPAGTYTYSLIIDESIVDTKKMIVR